jgi:ADP-ribose pyrophosphatase
MTQKNVWLPEYNADDFSVEDNVLLADSFYQFRRLDVIHKSFSGETVKIRRDLFCRPNAVAVLLYDATLDKVVLIEQFRIGALDHPRSPWLLELIAGIIEPGESIEEVAKRESFEESGVEVNTLQHICKFTPSPGGAQEYIDLFCATIDSTKASGIHGLAVEGEDIKVHVFSAQQAFDMLRTGEIDNAPAIIALQWLQLNKQNL